MTNHNIGTNNALRPGHVGLAPLLQKGLIRQHGRCSAFDGAGTELESPGCSRG